MLTRTTLFAVKLLVALSKKQTTEPVPLKKLAEKLDLSKTYLAKVSSLLVKAEILESHKGALGGVTLKRPATEISLLQIVESCQGVIRGDFFTRKELGIQIGLCGFHAAMKEVYDMKIEILSKWTLESMSGNPCSLNEGGNKVTCVLGHL